MIYISLVNAPQQQHWSAKKGLGYLNNKPKSFMAITIDEIMRKHPTKPHPEVQPHEGLFKFVDEVKLVSTTETQKGPKKGQVCSATMIYDLSGKYPGYVQLCEFPYWWELSIFNFA